MIFTIQGMEATERVPIASSTHTEDVSGPCRRYGLPRLLCMVAMFGGLQLVWSLIISHGTPYLKSLGLSDTITALTWASAPMCGTFLPPFFGSWSDRTSCTWGRRRPFILVGALATVFCVLILAWVEHLSSVIRYITGYSDFQHNNAFTKVFAVVAVIALNIAISPCTVGTRALLADVVRAEDQERVNAWVAYSTSLGNIFGFCAGTLDLPRLFRCDGISQFQALAVLTSVMVLITTLLCILATKEEVNIVEERSGPVTSCGWSSVVSMLCSSYQIASKRLKKVLLIQTFAWMGWFSFLFYGSSYVNQEYSGNDYRLEKMISVQRHSNSEADPLQTNTGSAETLTSQVTQIGSAATLLYAVVSLLTIVTLRACSSKLNLRVDLRKQYDTKFNMMDIWGYGHILYAILMLSTFVVRSWQGTFVIVGLMGIPWAATMFIPHALVATEISMNDTGDDTFRAHRGTILGLHNVAISAPQILAAILCSGIMGIASALGSTQMATWTLRGGIVPAMLAAYFTFTIDEI